MRTAGIRLPALSVISPGGVIPGQRHPEASAMHDMLVKLYNLPDPPDARAVIDGIVIRKPIGPEAHLVVKWVGSKFNGAWASETDVALANRPGTCFVAVKDKHPVGFACYDATALGFFGPMGVAGSQRGKGIGTALLLAALADMKARGYGYAVIGGVGPAEFYTKAVGAVDIPDSTPGIWETWMR